MQARAVAQATGARFLLLETRCPDDVVRQRLAARGAGPSDGRVELLDAQRGQFEPPRETPAEEHIVIDTSGEPDAVVSTALHEGYRRLLRR
jgi:predicted kinase